MTQTPRFNAASEAETPKWREESYRALADWWAAYLPPTFTTVKDRDDGDGGETVKVTVTDKHRADFAEAFIAELKILPLRRGDYGNEYILVNTSNYIPHDSPDGEAESAALEAALEKAGIFDVFFELEKMWTQLYADGQAFNTHGRIEHSAQPATPFALLKDLDFSAGRWFRQETRYLVVPLEPGQKIETCRLAREKDCKVAYDIEQAEAGKVLVIPSNDIPGFNRLTTADAFNLRSHPEIRFCYISDAATYADGAKLAEGTLEKVNDKGQFRKLSSPLQVIEVTESFATRSRNNYVILQPGDFATRMQTEHGDLFEAVPKAWTENGLRIMQPCTPDGALIDPTVLDKPVSVGRPLKIGVKAAT